MKKFVFTLLAISLLVGVSAQRTKCGIDTKALVREEVAAGASTLSFLAKMAPDYNRDMLLKADIVIGAEAGQIVTLHVPVKSLGVLESNPEVLQYSISHRIAQPECSNTRVDTRTDSVQMGLGTVSGMAYDGQGVYIGITDWGFDYTHPNLRSKTDSSLRVVRAWDQFRNAGPAPDGFTYGTEIVGEDALREAKGDTSNLYGYGTHGTHVAGICAGRGTNGNYIGQAPGAELLLCSFGLGEAEWMEGVSWMRKIANDEGRRLVVNSSWGMYSFSAIDGTSLLSQAINSWSDSSTVFCTSAGNNGNVKFHLSHDFEGDTLRTVATYYNYVPEAIGQCLIMWGEEGHDFCVKFRMVKGDSVWVSPEYNTADYALAGGPVDSVFYDTLVCGHRLIPYRVLIEHASPFDSRPHIQMDVDKDIELQLQLFITAPRGTVHAWNVANKTNHAGNEGTEFSSANIQGFVTGDILYGIGEPACAAKCIAVAAHSADRWYGTSYVPGGLAYFSSSGPLIDESQKPEVSAPGLDVVSSISAWTTDHRTTVVAEACDSINYIWSSLSGTSMSCPAVTGVVALMLQAKPDITVNQVRNILMNTARNDSYTGQLRANGTHHRRWGWGKVDALKAVNYAVQGLSIDAAERYDIPLRVYPNPASGMVTINSGCGGQHTMSIYAVDGTLMLEQTISTEQTINTSGWPQGVYIVRIGNRVEKLVVGKM